MQRAANCPRGDSIREVDRGAENQRLSPWGQPHRPPSPERMPAPVPAGTTENERMAGSNLDTCPRGDSVMDAHYGSEGLQVSPRGQHQKCASRHRRSACVPVGTVAQAPITGAEVGTCPRGDSRPEVHCGVERRLLSPRGQPLRRALSKRTPESVPAGTATEIPIAGMNIGTCPHGDTQCDGFG